MTATPPPDRSTPPTDHRPVWTEQRIRALGAATDLRTAASIFGIGRTQAYQLAKDVTFPVPVLRVGGRYRVPVAPILAALHMSGEPAT